MVLAFIGGFSLLSLKKVLSHPMSHITAPWTGIGCTIQQQTAYGKTLSITVSWFLLTLANSKRCQSQLICGSSVVVLASGAAVQSQQPKPLLYPHSGDCGSHKSALTLTTSGVHGGRLPFFLLGANCPFQLAIKTFQALPWPFHRA